MQHYHKAYAQNIIPGVVVTLSPVGTGDGLFPDLIDSMILTINLSTVTTTLAILITGDNET